MTWGKALLPWTASPAEAYTETLRLNHQCVRLSGAQKFAVQLYMGSVNFSARASCSKRTCSIRTPPATMRSCSLRTE